MSVKKLNSIDTSKEFSDDEYILVDDEFDQIRKFLGMYISYKGTKAAIHIFKEIFNNALDECVNTHSPADKIETYFDEDTREIIINDNGRGIPFEVLYDVTTKKHSTTKDGRKFNVESAGQNGVGLKVTAALSDYFSITSYRGDESKTIECIDGKIIDHKPIKEKKKQIGTVVKFIPSEKWLGKIDIKVDDICDWFRRMSYICPKNIKMKLYSQTSGNSTMITRVYEHEGLEADVEYLSESLEFKPINLSYSQGNEEDDTSTVLPLKCDMAFSYDKTTDEEIVDSYCNYVYTVDNGEHVDGCEAAICNFFTKEAKRLDPNAKYEVIYEDCRKGLILAVNCRCIQPDLAGQTKDKVTNRQIYTDTRKNMIKCLSNYFIDDQSTLKKIIDYLRKIAKIRMDAHSIKGIEVKKPMTWIDEVEITGFFPLENRNYKGYKELIITEGESAGGAVLGVRNPKYQAIFRLKGVVENTFDLSINKLMKNETLHNLVRVLGCGIGPDMNIANLKWNKIIICTDADIDGCNINSLLSVFFLIHLPDIIKEERLYKVIPPLYLIKNTGKNKNVRNVYYDKYDFNNTYYKIVSDNIDLHLVFDKDNTQKLNAREKIKWLDRNTNYLYYLNNLSKKTFCNPVIIENICWELLNSQTQSGNIDYLEFKTRIENTFKEMKFDIINKSLIGSDSGDLFISVIIDNIFIENARKIMYLISQNQTIAVLYKNINNKDDNLTLSSVGQFLTIAKNKFEMDIDQRFKGVGEVDGYLLFSTTINPLVRKLYRFTMSDIKNTIESFNKLHGKNSSHDRKKLIDGDFTMEDIDN